ncbi:hypothetical protein XENOCAPTIV_004747, partial [Xenoophorus captivus]
LTLFIKRCQPSWAYVYVPSRGEDCVGSSWESARQMQQKMQETLNNITTRLAVLETSYDLTSAPTKSSGGAHMSAGDLYPKLGTKEKPERPAPPSQAAAAVGGMAASHSPVVQVEQPPAYSPQAADGHVSISYGTESGEMSLVGDDFYSRTSTSTSSPQSMGEDGEELLYIPYGVQIFFVTPEGQVSAPSYPGYLRLVKFTSDSSDRIPRRPPAFLQVGQKPSDDDGYTNLHDCLVENKSHYCCVTICLYSVLCPFT